MKYRQITGDEAMKLCKVGTVVLAARYIDNMPFRKVSEEAVLLLTPEEPEQATKAPEPCATSHKAPKPAKAEGQKRKCKPLNIDISRVAELKAAGKTVAEIADVIEVTPKQMSQWLYNNKAKIEEAVQQLKDVRELAKACCRKEEADGD